MPLYRIPSKKVSRFTHRNESLSEIANLSLSRTEKFFTGKPGQSPGRYINYRRIEDACIRLDHGEDSIETIAESLEFGDRHHFSKIFIKYRGISIKPILRSKYAAPFNKSSLLIETIHYSNDYNCLVDCLIFNSGEIITFPSETLPSICFIISSVAFSVRVVRG